MSFCFSFFLLLLSLLLTPFYFHPLIYSFRFLLSSCFFSLFVFAFFLSFFLLLVFSYLSLFLSLAVFLLFFFVSSFGRVRSFHCFSPVVSAVVFRGTVPDVPASLNQFDFELFAVKLKQMTVMFPFAHAAYLHVVDHILGNPGFGRHRF